MEEGKSVEPAGFLSSYEDDTSLSKRPKPFGSNPTDMRETLPCLPSSLRQYVNAHAPEISNHDSGPRGTPSTIGRTASGKLGQDRDF